jgi:ABC-type amino acid transport substrate-binding protein
MNKNRCVRCVCLAGVLLLGFARAWCDETQGSDALADLRQRGTIEIAVYAQFPPYSYGTSAGTAKGIDVELARAIAQSLGLNLKLRMISAGESVRDDLRNHIWKGHYLGGGVADVMLHVGYDPVFASQEKDVVLFAPYFHESVVLAYKPGRIAHPESPLALTGHAIGVAGDTISDHIVSSAYGGALRATAVREPSLQEAVKAFKAGEVDGVMGPQGELQGLCAEQGVSDARFHPQERVGQMRTAWDVGVAVKNGGGASLSDAIGKTLADLKADGSLEKIFAAYGVKYVDAADLAADRAVARAARFSRTQSSGD